MSTNLDGVRAGDDAPILVSPLSLTMSLPSGIHNHSEPEDKIYSGRSPSIYDPGDRARQSNISSNLRQGSVSYQGNGPSSNLQTGTPPNINQLTHPYRQSVIPQPNPNQNVARPNSMYGQTTNFQSSDSHLGNVPSLDNQGSFPQSITRQDSILLESQPGASNITQTFSNSGRRGSNAIDPANGLPNTSSSSSTSSAGLNFLGALGEDIVSHNQIRSTRENENIFLSSAFSC